METVLRQIREARTCSRSRRRGFTQEIKSRIATQLDLRSFIARRPFSSVISAATLGFISTSTTDQTRESTDSPATNAGRTHEKLLPGSQTYESPKKEIIPVALLLQHLHELGSLALSYYYNYAIRVLMNEDSESASGTKLRAQENTNL